MINGSCTFHFHSPSVPILSQTGSPSTIPNLLRACLFCLLVWQNLPKRGEQGTPIFIIASKEISGIHVSPSPAKQSQLNTSHNICKTQRFCLKAEGLRMGLLLLWERNWRETGCRPYGKCPPPATLRGWVACCWTQHWWRDIWNPAVDITADILPVLWAVAAAITAANLVFHGPGTASRTTAYLVHTWG